MLREEVFAIERHGKKNKSMNRFIAYKLSILPTVEPILFSALL